MRLLTLLTPLHLLGCSMAMAIGGDPSAIEVHNASTTDIQLESLSQDPIDRNNGPFCLREKVWFRYGWDVRLPAWENTRDISDACGELWKALPSVACLVSSPHGCDPKQHNKTLLHWNFHTSLFCKPSHVEDAIAVGTRFKYGNLKCGE